MSAQGSAPETGQYPASGYPPPGAEEYPSPAAEEYSPPGATGFPPSGDPDYPPPGATYPPPGATGFPPSGGPDYPPPGATYPPPGAATYPPPGATYPPPNAGGYPPSMPPPYPGAYYDPMAPYGRHPLTGEPYSDKSKVIAGLLQLLGVIGFLGIGRMYLGQVGFGVAQLLIGWVGGFFLGILTCGVGFALPAVWGILDAVLMLTGNVRDTAGRPLRDGT